MLTGLDKALQFHTDALVLRGQRQQVLAGNIANADTPNYKAVDMDFAAALTRADSRHSGLGMAVSDSRHLASAAPGLPAAVLYRTPMQPSVDGNTVDMDVERAAFAENASRYEASFTFLNTRIRTLLTAIQG